MSPEGGEKGILTFSSFLELIPREGHETNKGREEVKSSVAVSWQGLFTSRILSPHQTDLRKDDNKYEGREVFGLGKRVGDFMGGIGKNRLAKYYYKIFRVITEHPTMSIYDIAVHTELSRNTVSKYVKEMYQRNIIMGPHIRMRSSPNYREYVYLMKFLDPYAAFKGLQGFPHVQYNALTFGDWNTLVITNRLIDFSPLVGFGRIVYQGIKYCTYTPLVDYTTWNQSFESIHEQLSRFTPLKSEDKERTYAPFLKWNVDEWKLFYAFKFNLREKVTPTLREIGVRYEVYTEWYKTLQDYCTIHTGFYPERYPTYMSHCFLLFTDHEQTVQSLFSSFPTTPVIMEVDDYMLIFVNAHSPDINRRLICTLYDMKSTEVIKEFHHAGVLYHFQ